MKKLAFILCLLAAPAFAEEAKPVVWVMVLQFKASSFSVNYPTEEKCMAAAKMASARMKKVGAGHADCVPVLQP